jgi:hypothetical protein
VFGELVTCDQAICKTLEHAYPGPRGTISFLPKIPKGTFLCVRGIHHITNRLEPLETFEITGVPGHSGLLFHRGNDNDDSAGCVLLGDAIKEYRIVDSGKAFARFMTLMDGINDFELEVTDVPISTEKLS